MIHVTYLPAEWHTPSKLVTLAYIRDVSLTKPKKKVVVTA